MKPEPSPSPRTLKKAGRSDAGNEFLAYVGSYNTSRGKGIHAFRFDAAAGRLESMGLATESVNPTFLTASKDGRFLYATKEVTRHAGKRGGAVKAFAIDRRTGKLRFLNEVLSGGTIPCYVRLDNTGRYAMVANYGSGSVTVIEVRRDGRLGKVTAFEQYSGSSVNPQRQEGPHAHSINVSPDNRFVIAADLGLDRLFVYRFDEKSGTLAPNRPAYATVNPGSGPRHIAFARNGRFVYVIGEMKSNITTFAYDAARGTLRKLQTISTLPRGYKGQSDCAEVAVSMSGKFVYGSNRGHDSIAVFAVDVKKGTLTPVERVPSGGRTPRHFAIDPTGAWLLVANQESDTVVVFAIDRNTGRLVPTGETAVVSSPACVRFVAS
ncbi:MAG: lactonase family protein [Acidobacteria bacterium]|nr:MAG: lactonase family protein [Acidobacteriota bacterium]